MFDGVFDDIGRRIHDALGTLAPDVFGAPVPAFPAVGVAHLQGEAAQVFEQNAGMAVRSVDGLAFTVAVALHEDGIRPVLLVHPADFAGDEFRRLVPGDADEFGLAAILGIAFAVRIPVDSLHRVGDAVWRVDPFLIAEGEGAGQGLPGGFEDLAVALHLPLPDLFLFILPAIAQRPDPDDLAVLDVYHPFGAAAEVTAESQGSQDCFVFSFDWFHRYCSPLVDNRVHGKANASLASSV